MSASNDASSADCRPAFRAVAQNSAAFSITAVVTGAIPVCLSTRPGGQGLDLCRPGAIRGALRNLQFRELQEWRPFEASRSNQFLHASFSGELFGFVIIPSGPASSRTTMLTGKAYSLPDDSHQESGETDRMSPAVPLHLPASTHETASSRQTRQFCESAASSASRRSAPSHPVWMRLACVS